MSENSYLPLGADVPLSTTPIDAKVGDEAKEFGLGLGDLVKHVGMAVAEAQRQLNATSAATAKKLAETTIDIVAVREREYDDAGQPKTVDPNDENSEAMVGLHTMKLPLSNFIDPVFYRWERVRLQGQFQATEWKANTQADASLTQYGGSVSLFVGAPLAATASNLLAGAGEAGNIAQGLGGGNVRGGVYYNNSNSSVDASNAHDVSHGQMRMNAELIPVADIGVPKPTQVFITPRIGILPGEVVTHANGVREMEVLIEYVRPVNRRDREEDAKKEEGERTLGDKAHLPIPNKTIVFEAPGLSWRVVDPKDPTRKAVTDPTGRVTDAMGRLHIVVSRELPKLDPTQPPGPANPDLSPKAFVVTARIGLVRNDTTIAL